MKPIYASLLLLLYLHLIFTGCSNTPTYLEAPVTITHASNYAPVDKIAVIIEPRPHPLLVPIIENMMQVLGSDWKIQIFHGYSNADFIYQSRLAPKIASGQIYLSEINRDNLTVPIYNNLMLNPYFWHNVLGENVLIFQADTILCSNATHTINQFTHWDYVGAPWKESDPKCYIYSDSKNPKYRYVVSSKDISLQELEQRNVKNIREYPIEVGNGGLSYRKRSKTLDVLKHYAAVRGRFLVEAEDTFYACVTNEPEANFKAPKKAQAVYFSVEQVFQESPFGVHKPWLNLSSREMDKLTQSCSELNILKSHYKWASIFQVY